VRVCFMDDRQFLFDKRVGIVRCSRCFRSVHAQESRRLRLCGVCDTPRFVVGIRRLL